MLQNKNSICNRCNIYLLNPLFPPTIAKMFKKFYKYKEQDACTKLASNNRMIK